jgi:hypothetical protein
MKRVLQFFDAESKSAAVKRSRFLTRFLTAAAAILASSAIVAPFYYSVPPNSPPGQIRNAHDLGIHLAVLEQFNKVLRSGAIYPRWLPDVNYGYGNAWPNFYPPGFYYATSLVYAVVANWIDALFVITSLGLAGSGFAFYLFARVWFGKVPSLIAALLYAVLPYHLIDFFWRGAFPEYLSFVLLPLILYFFYRVGSGGNARHYAGLGLCYGLSLLLHTPIAYLFSYVLVLYTAAWSIAERDWRVSKRIFLGMTIGVLLSAVYWLPAVAEIKYADETVTRLFQYHKNYITQLSGDGNYEHLLRQTFALQATALLLVIGAWRLLRKKGDSGAWRQSDGPRTKSAHTGIWAALGVFAVFMNLPISSPVARMIPKIEIVAFPSRWMAFMCLFAGLMTGAVIDPLIKQSGGWIVRTLAGVATAIVIVSNIWFGAQAVVIGSLSNAMVSPYSDFLVDTYCPKGAGPAASLPVADQVEVKAETATAKVARWEPLYRQCIISSEGPVVARFKTFNFPGWTAKIDGQDVTIASGSAQAQVVSIPPGSHTVEIVFGGTLPRHFGAGLTVIAAIVVLVLAVPLRLGSRAQGDTPVELLPSQPAAGLADSESAIPTHSTSIRFNRIWDLWVAVPIVAGLVFSAGMLINEYHPRPPDRPARRQVNALRAAIGLGSEAYLYVGTPGGVIVAADESALADLLTALVRRDEQKVETLLESGRSFRVEQNAKVRVLALSGGKVKVAILEGNNTSKEGWVLEGWLR